MDESIKKVLIIAGAVIAVSIAGIAIYRSTAPSGTPTRAEYMEDPASHLSPAAPGTTGARAAPDMVPGDAATRTGPAAAPGR